MLTTADVAQWLNVCTATVQRAVAAGKLKAYQMGTAYRFSVDDVQAFLDSSAVSVSRTPQPGERNDSVKKRSVS